MSQTISTIRTLLLPEYSGMTVGLNWALCFAPKDPGDTGLDYSLDVRGWCAEIEDTVRSFTVSWEPMGGTNDLVVTSAFAHNNICTIITEGGVAFTTYTMTFRITSQINGQVLERSVQLPVEPRYGNSIAAVSGAVSGVNV